MPSWERGVPSSAMSPALPATVSTARADYLGRPFELIDTGGIIQNDNDLIPSEILKQARVALEKAACVIFLVDGRAEITGADRDLAKMLRKLGKTSRRRGQQDRYARSPIT